ncbi:MAG: NUDIX hydrolase [Solobacterium sp.]|nr:NUDIX hydrolase [Solobacterium sp.]
MEEINEKGQTLKEFLDAYDDSKFRHPSNTVDMILMTVQDKKLKLLLIKRKDHPFIHNWALPGGFIEFDEDIEEAVRRELSEETNITDHTYFRQLYTFGNADRDPRTRVITTMYLSMTPVENIRNTRAGDDAQDAKWFTISKKVIETGEQNRKSILTLDDDNSIHMEYVIHDHAKHNYIETRSELTDNSNAQLAADHIKGINMAMDMLQNRAASTGIMFNLLPEECTLRQMQDVYEAIIGHKTDTGNFRRDIRRMLKETEKKIKVNGKNAALYRFNPIYTFLEENL